MHNNNLSKIYEILSKPQTRTLRKFTSFHSSIYTRNWDNTYSASTVHSVNVIDSEFFKLFWKTLNYLGDKLDFFKSFIEDWAKICQDHSSRFPKIEDLHPVYCGLNSNRSDSLIASDLLNGYTRLYHTSVGISNMTTSEHEDYTYKASESHAVQKALIRLREGTSITVKIYTEKNRKGGETIYFNKNDILTVAFLQVYAICQSWTNYTFYLNNPDDNISQISKILSAFKHALLNNITSVNWTNKSVEEVGEEYLNIRHALECIEENILKINNTDNLLPDFAQQWQKRLYQIELNNANDVIYSQLKDAQQVMTQYSKIMDLVRKQQKSLQQITTNEQDAQFLTDYLNFFKTVPNTIFHNECGKYLYCIYETPFAHTDHNTMRHHIDAISENSTPSKPQSPNGNAFIENYCRLISNSLWRSKVLPEKSDAEYWKAFARATKRLLKEIFVDLTTTLYISVCLRWDSTTTTYSAQGVKTSAFPSALQDVIKQRVWHPHITYFNCWSAALGEITRALTDRDPQTAFEYTIAASGQISYPETAGSKIASLIWGLHDGYGGTNCETTTREAQVYKRMNSNKRETFLEIITDYIKEEFGEDVKNSPKTETKTEPHTTNTNINDRLLWLETHRADIPANTQIIPITDAEDTRFTVNGSIYIFLPSGDFLTPAVYEAYKTAFPTAPRSDAQTPVESVPDENLINLSFYPENNAWLFPAEHDLPEDYSFFANYMPGIFLYDSDTMPNINPELSEVVYDKVEDIIYFIRNGTKYIIDENVIDQVERR